MNCEHVNTLFLAYHDGDLSQEEKTALEDHLKTCATCAADWDAYLLTLNEVSGMFPVAAPDDFALRVKQTIGKRSRGRFFGEERPLGMSFAVVSFVLILLFLMAYYYLFSTREITVLSGTVTQTAETDTGTPNHTPEK